MTKKPFEIHKVYNGNEYTREDKRGRLHTGIIGTRYIPVVDGESVGDPLGYKTKKEAIEAAKHMGL